MWSTLGGCGVCLQGQETTEKSGLSITAQIGNTCKVRSSLYDGVEATVEAEAEHGQGGLSGGKGEGMGAGCGKGGYPKGEVEGEDRQEVGLRGECLLLKW